MVYGDDAPTTTLPARAGSFVPRVYCLLASDDSVPFLQPRVGGRAARPHRLREAPSVSVLRNVHCSEKNVSRHDRRSHLTCFLSLSFPSEHDNIVIPRPQGALVSLGSGASLACLLSKSRQRGRVEHLYWLWRQTGLSASPALLLAGPGHFGRAASCPRALGCSALQWA